MTKNYEMDDGTDHTPQTVMITRASALLILKVRKLFLR